MNLSPTSYPELNAVLREFVTGIQAALRENFMAAYLQGSFALGAGDADSDVDFLVVTKQDISGQMLTDLESFHLTLYQLESPWAQHLEGSYFPEAIVKRDDPAHSPLLYLDNGRRTLERSTHDNALVVRWVVRERGILLAGVDAKTLIDPISAEDLKRAVLATMHSWSQSILAGHWQMKSRWSQSFATVSYCRMLHTLATGEIHSKLAGVTWAIQTLGESWADVIQRAWDDRPNPDLKAHQSADAQDIQAALTFIEYAIARSQQDNMTNIE